MRILILPLIAGLAACTPTAAETARATERDAVQQQKLAAELAGLTPGKPQSCISQTGSYQVKAFGPTILYEFGSRLIYRSDTAGGCENIGRGDILITRTSTGQLCQGDIGRTVDSTSRAFTGSCGFAQFTPYRKR